MYNKTFILVYTRYQQTKTANLLLGSNQLDTLHRPHEKLANQEFKCILQSKRDKPAKLTWLEQAYAADVYRCFVEEGSSCGSSRCGMLLLLNVIVLALQTSLLSSLPCLCASLRAACV